MRRVAVTAGVASVMRAGVVVGCLAGALLLPGSGAVAPAFGHVAADTTPPTIQQPPDFTTTATSKCGSSACATISYSLSVSDPDNTSAELTVSCSEPSGSTQPLGTALIHCQAQDPAGNNSNIVYFHSTVVEPPPTFSNVPGPITVEATSSSGAVAHYTTPTATDLVDGNLTVSCDHASGIYVFPIGTTTVTCKATNSNNETATATFTVTVTAPSSGGGSSGGGTTGGTSGGSTGSSGGGSSSGGAGTGSGGGGSSSTGSSGGGGAPPAGQDTTPPILADHKNVRVYATTLSGAVVTYTVIATDPDDTGAQVRITCLPASGSIFPLASHGQKKTTTVTCAANDAAGNNAVPKSFTVTVLGFRTRTLKRRTRTHNCTLRPLPDRHCSPGAYYPKLTKTIICSPNFRTSKIRHVTNATRHKVEREYGLAARGYGKTLEIDRIIPLELGGSNSIANLYPEKAKFADGSPGYHAKDKLENKLHKMVCYGDMALYRARQQIAANWEKLYTKVYGQAPTG